MHPNEIEDIVNFSKDPNTYEQLNESLNNQYRNSIQIRRSDFLLKQNEDFSADPFMRNSCLLPGLDDSIISNGFQVPRDLAEQMNEIDKSPNAVKLSNCVLN